MIFTQAAIFFGVDAVALIGFLLTMRQAGLPGWGRGAPESICAEETAWVCSAAERCIRRAEEYIAGENFGDLSVGQIVEGL